MVKILYYRITLMFTLVKTVDSVLALCCNISPLMEELRDIIDLGCGEWWLSIKAGQLNLKGRHH